MRRLLEHALPGVRVNAALAREAAAVSGGLSGRLCRILAHGLGQALDMSKPASFRTLAGALPEASVPLPDGARELAELLAVAGGELGPVAAERALGSAQALAAAYRGLLALGMATRDGERLCLRTDRVAALRDALPRARLLELAARLGERDLDGRARAHVLAARGERERAISEFARRDCAAARARRDRASRAMRARGARAARRLDGQARSAARARPMRLARRRAQGRYLEARTALGEAATARRSRCVRRSRDWPATASRRMRSRCARARRRGRRRELE